MAEVVFHIVGTTPKIMHRVSAKTRQQLLLPPEYRKLRRGYARSREN
jgi:hypothetical protein